MYKRQQGHCTAEAILNALRPDRKFTKEEARLLDLCMVLHAEHGGGNNSTFTTRVLTLSLIHIYKNTAVLSIIGDADALFLSIFNSAGITQAAGPIKKGGKFTGPSLFPGSYLQGVVRIPKRDADAVLSVVLPKARITEGAILIIIRCV